MKTVFEKESKTEILMNVDVVVAGGGPAGLGAAIAAARNGCKVVLIEKFGFLGGMLTAGLLGSMSAENKITGIAQEIIDRMIDEGGAVGIKGPKKGIITPYDSEMLKYIAFQMLEEAGAKILLHSNVVGVVQNKGKLNGVLIENKSGRQAIFARVIIDATGDGDVAFKAGAMFKQGRDDGYVQPASLFFRMGNVNDKDLIHYIENNQGEFNQNPRVLTIDHSFRPIFIKVTGFYSLIKKAVENGELYCLREVFAVHSTPIQGQFSINGPRIIKFDGTNIYDLTRGEIDARKQVMSCVKFLKKHVPGFSHSYLLDVAPTIGVRETRRITGEYVLSMDDIVQDKSFYDSIAVGSYPIDIHDPLGKGQFYEEVPIYEIPYRSLVTKGIDNLLLAGRCISETHEALASTRTTPMCIATGQAAGTAASLMVKDLCNANQVNINNLHDLLQKQGLAFNKELYKKA